MRIKNKVAIVTGGASGFGEGIARRFAAEGAEVVIADINYDAAYKVADEIGNQQAIPFQVDVSEPEDTKKMMDFTISKFGQLDILVQNAAIGMSPQPLEETPLELFDKLFKINVRSVYLGSYYSVPIFKKQGRGGVIINTISTAAIRPRPGLTAYNASKGALIPMTKALALELADDKIRVNGLCPVAGETAMLNDFLGKGNEEEKKEIHKKFIATVPLGRLAQPRDMANAALYLASDEADFITGVMFEIDGGRSI